MMANNSNACLRSYLIINSRSLFDFLLGFIDNWDSRFFVIESGPNLYGHSLRSSFFPL